MKKKIKTPKDKKLDLESIRFYGYDGEYFPSVTSIGKAKSKGEGYDRWLGNAKSFKAACEYRDYRRDIGLLIHQRATGFYNHRDPGKYRTHRGYMESLRKFLDIYKVRPVAAEEKLINRKQGYGGTLDLLASVQGDVRKVGLIDYKTGGLHEDQHPLQLGPYYMTTFNSKWARQYPKRRRPRFAALVKLSENGEFNPNRDVKWYSHKDMVVANAAFIALKKVFDWENRNKSVNEADLKSHCLEVKKLKILI